MAERPRAFSIWDDDVERRVYDKHDMDSYLAERARQIASITDELHMCEECATLDIHNRDQQIAKLRGALEKIKAYECCAPSSWVYQTAHNALRGNSREALAEEAKHD